MPASTREREMIREGSTVLVRGQIRRVAETPAIRARTLSIRQKGKLPAEKVGWADVIVIDKWLSLFGLGVEARKRRR